MLVLRHRLAIAGIIAAAAIAVPVAALASGPGAPPAKPGPSAAAAPAASKSAPPGMPGPSSNPVPPAAAASKAAAAAAAAAGKPDVPAPISEFAAQLGVSATVAGPAFKQVAGLAQSGSADPSSPAFAAVARELGVSPQRLAAAWAAAGKDAGANDGGGQGAAAK
jgi:hypothetical protein